MNNETKSGAKSKTLWINYLVVIGAVINEITPVLQDSNMTRTAMILAVVNIILRYVTKGAVKFPF